MEEEKLEVENCQTPSSVQIFSSLTGRHFSTYPYVRQQKNFPHVTESYSRIN